MKTIQSISLDSKLAAERLAKLATGEICSYEELSKLIGRNAQNGGRACIQTARRILQRDKQMIFDCVHNVGYKRLNDLEIVGTGEHTRKRIHRAAKRGFQTITCVQEFDKLPNEAKVRHNAYASAFGMVAHVLTRPTMKKLEGKVATAQAQLPLQKTLEAFRD